MISEPILVIGCPRSGTTLLFNVLSEVPALWSIGYESKGIIERYHHPSVKNWASGALDEHDLTPESRAFMLHEFEAQAAPGTTWQRVNGLRARLRRNRLWQSIKRRGQTTDTGSAVSSALPGQGLGAVRRLVRLGHRLAPRDRRAIRLLEKTPENCLRLPFLLALFPDARVLYLTRDARSNINSLIEGWQQPHLFPGYQVPEALSIPGYTRNRWAFTLIPGWRELASASLAEVCARQWIACNQAVMAHRDETAGRVPYLTVRYEDLTAEPQPVLRQIAAFAGVPFEGSLERHAARLPRINAVSAPEREKWRRENGPAIENILPLVAGTMERLGYEI